MPIAGQPDDLALLGPSAPETESRGVLLITHGGNEQRRRAVREVATPVARDRPVAIAFTTGDADVLVQAALKLADRGVHRIGVVRLFISGRSWRDRIEAALGLETATGGPDAGVREKGDWRPSRLPALKSLSFRSHQDGLNRAPETSRILFDRARDMSRAPEEEDVLVLAHGVGDPEGNARWRERMARRCDLLQGRLPFHRVAAETLAEDWPELRRDAEERVRSFVAGASEGDRTCLVIPFRLHGFGPYAEVLEGLDYRADGRALLPHPAVTHWIRRQAGLDTE